MEVNKKFVKKKKFYTIFIQFFLSYVLVISLILSSIMFLLYSSIKKQTNDEIAANNNIMMESLANSLDMLILDKIATGVISRINAQDERFQIFIKGDPLKDIIATYNLIKELSNIKLSNEFISDIYLYRSDGEVISTSCFFNMKGNTGDKNTLAVNYALNEYAKNKNAINMWIGTHDDPLDSNQKIITYVCSNLLGDFNNNHFLIIDIYESKFEDLLNQSSGAKRDNLILNAEGDVILSSGSLWPKDDRRLVEILDDPSLEKSEGYFIKKIRDINCFVSFTTSKEYRWKYISIIKYEALFSSLTTIRIFMIVVSAFIWVAGLFVSAVLSWRQYKPIHTIERLTGNLYEGLAANNQIIGNDNPMNPKSSSYQDIFTRLINSNDIVNEMKKKIVDYTEGMKNTALLLLTTSNIKESLEIVRKLETIGIPFYNGINYVMAFSAHMDNVLNTGNIKAETDCLAIISDLLEKKMKIGLNANIHALWNGYGILIINSKLTEIDEQYVIDSIDSILHDFMNKYNIPVYAGLSSKCAELTRFKRLSSEAVEALQCSEYFERQNVCNFSEICHIDKNDHLSIIKYLDDIANSLHAGNQQQCTAMLSNVFEILLKKKLHVAEYERIIDSITELVVGYIYKHGMNIQTLYESDQPIDIASIKNFKTNSQHQAFIIDLLSRIIAGKAQGKIKNYEIVEKMKKYVADNITGNININIISEKLHYNKLYCQRIFKEHEGISFNEYLLKARMAAAEGLLTKTNMKVTEMAMHLNFSTTYYFIKKFKEFSGMTPKAYRAFHNS